MTRVVEVRDQSVSWARRCRRLSPEPPGARAASRLGSRRRRDPAQRHLPRESKPEGRLDGNLTVAALRGSLHSLATNLTRSPRGPARADCHLARRASTVKLTAGRPRSVGRPHDRRGRAPLAIRHHGDGQVNSARARAQHHGSRPSSKGTALTAIHPQQYQPEPAPLHAREDDSGDTGRRSSTPPSSPADGPWPRPMASGQCPTPTRRERHATQAESERAKPHRPGGPGTPHGQVVKPHRPGGAPPHRPRAKARGGAQDPAGLVCCTASTSGATRVWTTSLRPHPH